MGDTAISLHLPVTCTCIPPHLQVFISWGGGGGGGEATLNQLKSKVSESGIFPWGGVLLTTLELGIQGFLNTKYSDPS